MFGFRDSAGAAVRRCSAVLAALFALTAVGCGGPGTVSGTVKYRSKELTRGEVHFIQAGGQSASGSINPDGTYRVTNVPVGPVTVTVVSYATQGGSAQFGITPSGKAPKMSSAIPIKFNDPATSRLKYTITSGSQRIDLDLTD